MRPGFTRSRPYRSSGTHLVSRNLRGSTTRVTSPRTRTSFPIIGLALDSWVTPRRTLASPRLTHLHHHHRIDHLHHHPSPQQPQAAALPSHSPDIEDPVLSLTERFDSFWDETQEHRVLVTQDMEALRANMQTVLANQAIILQQQQTMQAQLAQLLAFHQPPPPPPQ